MSKAVKTVTVAIAITFLVGTLAVGGLLALSYFAPNLLAGTDVFSGGTHNTEPTKPGETPNGVTEADLTEQVVIKDVTLIELADSPTGPLFSARFGEGADLTLKAKTGLQIQPKAGSEIVIAVPAGFYSGSDQAELKLQLQKLSDELETALTLIEVR